MPILHTGSPLLPTLRVQDCHQYFKKRLSLQLILYSPALRRRHCNASCGPNASHTEESQLHVISSAESGWSPLSNLLDPRLP